MQATGTSLATTAVSCHIGAASAVAWKKSSTECLLAAWLVGWLLQWRRRRDDVTVRFVAETNRSSCRRRRENDQQQQIFGESCVCVWACVWFCSICLPGLRVIAVQVADWVCRRTETNRFAYSKTHSVAAGFSVLGTALLEWISEYAVRTYTTPDSAVSYLNRAQMPQTTPSFALGCTTAAKSSEIVPVLLVLLAECGLTVILHLKQINQDTLVKRDTRPLSPKLLLLATRNMLNFYILSENRPKWFSALRFLLANFSDCLLLNLWHHRTGCNFRSQRYRNEHCEDMVCTLQLAFTRRRGVKRENDGRHVDIATLQPATSVE